MNLLERKTDFDEKVRKFNEQENRGDASLESSYSEYLIKTYKEQFKSVTHSEKRNYVIIDFNKINNN